MGATRNGRRCEWLPRRFHRACAQGPGAQEELDIFSCFCCGDGFGAHCKESTDKQNAGAPKLGVCEPFAINPSGKAHCDGRAKELEADRKSTRLNSSHVEISYAVFCLKKKKIKE